MVYSGDVNKATTTSFNYNTSRIAECPGRFYLIIFGTGSTDLQGQITSACNTKLNYISVETSYKCTIYSRNITIDETNKRFTTGTGYYWRNNATTAGDYCHIYQIYVIGWN